MRACCDSRSGSRQWWYRWEASNGSFSKKSVFRAAVRYATLIVKISNVAAVYHRLAGQRVRFDHPPPPPSGMDGGSPLSPALFLSLSLALGFFSSRAPTRHDRSLSPPASKQSHARTHARTHTRARSQRSEQVSPVCARGKYRSQTMRTGRRIHIFRCTLAGTPRLGTGERGEEETRGEERKGREKKRDARKSLRIVKLWNMETE